MDEERIKKLVRELLIELGEDPTREGLLGTPSRVSEMYSELFSGIGKDASREIDAIFNENLVIDNSSIAVLARGASSFNFNNLQIKQSICCKSITIIHRQKITH